MANRHTITTNEKFTREITQYTNIDDSQITIMESILKNILLEHRQAVESGSDWKTPLGIFIAVVAFFGAGDFNKDFLSISKSYWGAVFMLILMGSIIWFFRSAYFRWKNRNENIDSLILKIKASEKTLL